MWRASKLLPGHSAPLLAAWAVIWCLGCLGCAPRDARVGSFPAPDAAPPTLDAANDGPVLLFSSELESNGGQWNVQTILDRASVVFGANHANAGDGRVAELVFPGDPNLTSTDAAGPAAATEIASRQYFRFGTFRTRVQFATCAPGEEIASAVFMYFNDGRDGNGNGVTDSPELDFQVFCGAPTFIVLTAWADFQREAGGQETFSKSSRAIDTATGDMYDAVSPTERAFARTGTSSALVRGGFPAPGAFYEVGIEWTSTHVRFFIVLDGAEVTLWDMTDVRYVPQVPLPLMYNLWHPQTHWVPQMTVADYPASDGTMRIDWVRFFAP
jgi:hypothetical protein